MLCFALCMYLFIYFMTYVIMHYIFICLLLIFYSSIHPSIYSSIDLFIYFSKISNSAPSQHISILHLLILSSTITPTIGPSAGDYSNDNFYTINIIAGDRPPPPPNLKEVIFSNSGTPYYALLSW